MLCTPEVRIHRKPLTRWKLERDSEAIVWTGAFRPLQLRVKGVQDVELHGLEEAVALVLKDDRHHHLAAILQIPLDVADLRGGEGHTTVISYMLLQRRAEINRGNLTQEPNERALQESNERASRKFTKSQNHRNICGSGAAPRTEREPQREKS